MKCVICGKPTNNDLETCSIDCYMKYLKFQGKKMVLEEMKDGSFYLHPVSIDYGREREIKIPKEKKKKIKDHTSKNQCGECGKSIVNPFAFTIGEDNYKISKDQLCSQNCVNNCNLRYAKWFRMGVLVNYEIKVIEKSEVIK